MMGRATIGLAPRQTSTSAPAPGQVVVTALPDTWEGIQKELGRMQVYVRDAIRDPLVLDTARLIPLALGEEQSQDPGELVKAVFDWVKGVTRYVPDPYRTEVMQTVPRMLKQLRTPPEMVASILDPILRARAERGEADGFPHQPYPIPAKVVADCEEIAMLVAAMIVALGINVRFRLGGDEEEDGYHHIWVQARPYPVFDSEGKDVPDAGWEDWDIDLTVLSHTKVGDVAYFEKYATLPVFPET